MTLQILLIGALATILIAGFALWADTNIKAAYRSYNKGVAFAAAEAGIEYYRWHLAHAPLDYYDGLGATSTGPYVHVYYDKNGIQLGTFSLEITAPPTGSTVTTIKSTGKVDADATVQRAIRVKLAKASFAKYAVVADGTMRFGSGTETFGPLHSNSGIRFDGFAHNIITSAVSSYNDPDHSGNNEYGVHTHINAPPATGMNDAFRPLEAPTSTLQARTDVFEVGRQFPAAPVDFAGLTVNLSQMKADAISAGVYVPSSSAVGYEVTLMTSSTFLLRKVLTSSTPPGGCTNTLSQSGWGTWTVGNATTVGTYAFPANGILFIEDNVWVKGQIKNARLTIASGKFPDNATTRTSITFASSTLYTYYDSQDVLSFIAQNNVNIALWSENTVRIDGAMIAQNGRVGRYYYSSSCGAQYIRQQLTSFGMIGTSQRYGFAYTDGTGYQIRTLIYDANLLYSPPPSFPLTTDQYAQISWQEL